MSFREKCAWASFFTTVVLWSSYFVVVIRQSMTGADLGISMAILFIAVIIVQIVAVIIVAAAVAIRSPGDANDARDERDRAIGRRAGSLAYLAVMLGLVAVIVALHVGLHGRDTIFALLGLFVLGEATRFGTQAIGYRAGS